ncbi:separin [Plakobranchus ocellatus]|uniref:separase n=1 Tax=Plakobranchus ocellatus TaxID=259542 RepID=A0AAV4D646_9GAST|nr:separin [Plakobranchus ocellatus]
MCMCIANGRGQCSRATFYQDWVSKLALILTILDKELKHNKLPEDVAVLQRFLYESIEFVASFKGVGDGDCSALESWLKLMKDLLPVVVNQHAVWKGKGLKYSTVLVYLNHLTYQIVEAKLRCLSHFKVLASAMFNLLCACIHSGEVDQPGLVTDVTHKTYSLLCAAGQRVQKSESCSYIEARRCYELYLLAAACLNLDSANKVRDGMKTARDFMSSYFHMCAEWDSKAAKSTSNNDDDFDDRDYISGLMDAAVRAYTAQPRDLYGDASLSYFMELFRISKWQRQLVNKLFDCDGNLFNYRVDKTLLTFSNDSFELLKASNLQKSNSVQLSADSKVKSTIMSLLRLSQIMVGTDIKDGHQAQQLEEQLAKNSHFDTTVEQILAFLCETAKPLRSSIGEALIIFLKNLSQIQTARQFLHVGTLRLCYRMSSLTVRVIVRDVLKFTSKQDQVLKLQAKIYDLAMACKARLNLLQAFVAKVHSDVDEMTAIASYVKPCLTALTHLVNVVNQKNLIDSSSNYYRQIQKCLECAVSSIGSIGRNLRRQEEYEVAVALLSRLWPVANVPELIPLVNYHESLVVCCKGAGQFEKVLTVMKECAALDVRLFTDTLLKILAKIAGEKPSIDLLSVFEPCSRSPKQHAQILGRAVKVMLTGQPAAGHAGHCKKILTALTIHPGLTTREKAVYKFLLAEHAWFHFSDDNFSDMTLKRCEGEPFALAQEAMTDLAADEDGLYEDFFVQAAFLVWDMLNRAACLKNISKLPKSSAWQTSSQAESAAATPSEPADSLARQHCPVKTDLLVNLNLILTSEKVTVQEVSMIKGACPSDQPILGPEHHQVDSDLLMQKAKICLALWTSWFKSHSENLSKCSAELDSFRVDKSLSFLIKIAELAILCHQSAPAVRALCQARKFSILYNKPEVTKRVTGTLVSTLVQFGLPLKITAQPGPTQSSSSASQSIPVKSAKFAAPVKGLEDGVNRNEPGRTSTGRPGEASQGLLAQDVWLLEQLGLSSDCHLLQLVSLAFQYLRTGEVSNFLNLRGHILRRIEELRQKGPLTPNCTLSLSALHRLTAEFYASPASAKYRQPTVIVGKDSVEDAEPYAVESGSDSLKYITSVATFYLGEKFKDVKRGVSLETWRLIHEYLSTLKLQGELYVLTGNLKYARTHLYEGLRVAESCLLNPWITVFASRLAEISVDYSETMSEAHLLVLHSVTAMLAYRSRQNGETNWSVEGGCQCSCGATQAEWSSSVCCDMGQKQAHTKKKDKGQAGQGCPFCIDTGNAKMRQHLTEIPEAFELNEKEKIDSEPQSSGTEEESSAEASSDEGSSLSPEQAAALMAKCGVLMLEPDSCDLCHHEEMAEARARLLCLHAELCYREHEDKTLAARSFERARCVASRSKRMTTALELMAQQALCEAQLDHLSVSEGLYRQHEWKRLELTVLAWQAEMRLRMLRHEDKLMEKAVKDIESLLSDETEEDMSKSSCSGGKTAAKPLKSSLSSCCLRIKQEAKDKGKPRWPCQVEEVSKWLRVVGDEAKQMEGQAGANILEATAKVMNSHLKYLPILKCMGDNDDIDNADDEGAQIFSDEQVITNEIKDALSNKAFWDQKMMSRLNMAPASVEGLFEAAGHQLGGVRSQTNKQDHSSGLQKGSSKSSRAQLSGSSVKHPATKSSSIKIFNDSYVTPCRGSVLKSSENITASVGLKSARTVDKTAKRVRKMSSKVLSLHSEEASVSGPRPQNGLKGSGDESLSPQQLNSLNIHEEDSSEDVDISSRQIFTAPKGKENSSGVVDCTNTSTARRRGVGRARNYVMLSSSSDDCASSSSSSSPALILQKHKELMAKIGREGNSPKPKAICAEDQENKAKQEVVAKTGNSGKTRLGKSAKTELEGGQSKSRLALDNKQGRRNGRTKTQAHAVVENVDDGNSLLNTSSEISRAVQEDVGIQTAEAIVSKQQSQSDLVVSEHKRGSTRARRLRRKGSPSPECKRQGDGVGDIVVTTPDLAGLRDELLEELASSPGHLNSSSFSSNSTRSICEVDTEMGTSFSSPGSGSIQPGETDCSSDNPFHSLASFVEDDFTRGMSRLHSDRTGVVEVKAENLMASFVSPMEIPRGRPQRRKAESKSTTKQAKEDKEQVLKTPSPVKVENDDDGDDAEKENVILCTPEGETGKSPFPLLTPKTKPRSNLSLKKLKANAPPSTMKREALALKDVSENNSAITSKSVKDFTSKRPAGAKAKLTRNASKNDIEEMDTECQSCEPEETIKRKASRAPRRGTTRGKTYCNKVSEKDSVREAADEEMEVAALDVGTQSPLKRLSDEHIECASSLSDCKNARKLNMEESTLAGITDMAVTKSKRGKSVRSHDRCNKLNNDRLLHEKLGDIEKESLLVETTKLEIKSQARSVGDCSRNCTLPGNQATNKVSMLHHQCACSSRRLSSDDEEALWSLFPTLCLHDPDSYSSEMDELATALTQLRHFPPSYLYGQVCKSLAMAKWENSMIAGCQCSKCQYQVAAHLTASMHVTYRHMLTRNMRSKLRKTQKTGKSNGRPTGERTAAAAAAAAAGCGADAGSDDDDVDDEWLGDEQLAQERHRMTMAVEDIAFRGDEVEKLKSYVECLPPDYTVAQLSVVDFDPMNPAEGQGQVFVTRLTPDLQPISVGIPLKRMRCLRNVFKTFDSAIVMDSDYPTNDEYWAARYKADAKLQNIVHYLQLSFLGSHTWLLCGRVAELRESETAKATLDEAASAAVKDVAEAHHGYSLDKNVVRALLDPLLFANEYDIRSLLHCLWPASIVDTLITSFLNLQDTLLKNAPDVGGLGLSDKRGLHRGAVVFILDKTLTRLPWESMPNLSNQMITRVPSLATLKVLLRMHQERIASPVEHGVDRSDAVAVIDPESNLQFSSTFLLPQFQQIRGWTCLSQKPPTVSDLKAILTEHSIYLYVGHGWGKQFVGGDDLQMFRGKAVAVVMGCYSSKLEHRPRVDGDGAPLYFLLAGCPAVMGNLWVVTDKDIDKLTSCMVQQWMTTPSPLPLGLSLNRARNACKLVGLNGFAPVIYGLPVQIVDKKWIRL